jgi:TRAP-type mannitol/chloroaromatic compound transport system permease small subunit
MVVWPVRVVFFVSFSVLALQVFAELLKAVLKLRSQPEA